MRTLLILLAATLSLSALAQKHEAGITLGTTNLLGDFGGGPGDGTIFVQDIDIQSFRFGAGVFYRFTPHPNISLRGQLTYLGLSGSDDLTSNRFRFARGLSASGSAIDVMAMVEWNILKLPVCQYKNGFTPVLGAGIGFGSFNTSLEHRSGVDPFTGDVGQLPSNQEFMVQDAGNSGVVIPVSLGFKYNIRANWMLGLETVYRFSLTDEIDRYVRQQKDQYFMIGTTVSYVFCKGGTGRMKCPTY